MAQQTISVTASQKVTVGDSLITAFGKCNDNFTEVYAMAVPGGSSGDIQYNNAGAFGGSILVMGTNTISQINSTNAQTHYVYGTYTDGSNYRRLYVKANNNTGDFRIGVEGLGSGANGNTLRIDFGTGTYNYITYTTDTLQLRFSQIDDIGGYWRLSDGLRLHPSGMVRIGGSGPGDAMDTGLARNAAGVFEINNGSAGAFRDLRCRDVKLHASASLTPATNGELNIEATNDTTLTFKFKGSDGTVRSGTITLS